MFVLTDAQLAVLTPALAREDRCIFPITANLKGGAVGNVARSLLRRGLLEEVTSAANDVVWRCGEDGTSLTLRATDAAVRALGGEVVDAGESIQPSVEQALGSVDAPKRKPGAAQTALLALLNRAEGATIAEMQEATGWQPHSVRGALSGVVSKKLGHKVASAKEERGRVYRIQS